VSDESLRFSFDSSAKQILVYVGKVEIGQHVHSAFQSIVASSLNINPSHISVCPVTTASSPNDGLTAGSLSMQVTGESLRTDADALRKTLIKQAAQALNADANDIVLNAKTLELSADGRQCSLFDLPKAKSEAATLLHIDPLKNDLRKYEVYKYELRKDVKSASTDSPNATSTIPASVRGERIYIQDLILPGMVYARALRGRVSNLTNTDTVRVIKDGGFSAMVATTEKALDNAWAALGTELPERDSSCDGPVANWIQHRRVDTNHTGDTSEINGTVFQSASRPFLLHASIAPSCAIALFKDDTLNIWTHSQGIFVLREEIARQIELDPEQVIVRHVPSAGSYGHNAADDAAMDAVLVSLQMPGTPVRVDWTRQDEFQHSPTGAPMQVQAEVQLNDDNSIGSWRQTIWSGPHGQRPGGGGNVNLLASIEKDPQKKSTNIPDLPDAVGGGAARNATPPYSVGSFGVTTHLVQDLPVRSSSIRGLGAQLNVLCIETVVEQLAERCAMDSLEFRLKHIEDSRGYAVLEKLQSIIESQPASSKDNEAIGISYSRYKEKAAYAAVAVRLQLTEKIELKDVWAVVDAGRIVDKSGTVNQIEGGIIQAASWTLCEGVLLRSGYVDATSWDDYPIMGWSDIPEIHTIIIETDATRPSLGVGECMVGPVSAAIVNGVSKISGSYLADLPLTRENLIKALAASD